MSHGNRERVKPPSLATGMYPKVKNIAATIASDNKKDEIADATLTREVAGRCYISTRNFGSVKKRLKSLPLDANAAATKAKLYQLDEHCEFRCCKCRKDRIYDDIVAYEDGAGCICVPCFSKIVKPKNFRPTRMIPFPTLLSWLNYQPPPVETTVSEDVAEQSVAAVLPSGHRVEQTMLTGGPVQTDVRMLPATPLNPFGDVMEPGARGILSTSNVFSAGILSGSSEAQPAPCAVCASVFGRCSHGPGICIFSNAPIETCLLFFMGLCNNGELPDGTRCGKVFHDPLFGLPDRSAGPCPSRDEGEGFDEWIQLKKKSLNTAEWQLWDQEGAIAAVERCTPASKIHDEYISGTSSLKSLLNKIKAKQT